MELTFDPNVDATAASVCAFVADIQSKIGDIEDLTTWLRCREAIDNLKICIRQLPLPVDKLSARSKSLLELSGTTLWNTALRLSASQGDSPNEDFHRFTSSRF
ncbi:hypothetical protein VTN31DRAFT_7055 [Thermomyces dupontii]|uniref:uncharacterized protein n=1 Tax=Talaromyces thermophilus TaxID=28565 RepID=UPI003741EC98